MRPLRPLRPGATSAAHAEAVARRLALLDAELTAVRTGTAPTHATHATDPGDPDGDDGWDVAPARHDPTSHAPGGRARELSAPVAWAVPDTHTRPRPVGRVAGPRERWPVPWEEASPADDAELAGPPGSESPEVVIGTVPRVGRHASRRDGGAGTGATPPAAPRSWSGLVPETLRGRAGLGPAHLAVVAVLVSLGLGVTCWAVLRSTPEELPATAPAGALVSPSVPGGAPPSAPPTGAPSPGTPAASAPAGAGGTPAAAGAEVVVDVAGKVRRPGIAVLPGGSRVADALEAAGGARPGVDLTSLNLARVLLDGEQVLVGVAAAPGVPGAPAAGAPPTSGGTGAGAPPGSPTALVDLNTADLALLDTLPGVGPVTAQAILDWRAENGGFTAVEDLLDVSGIGEVTLAELTPLVTV